MLQKRGSTQVDWAISLALFIFYLAWFFIFVNPTAVSQVTPEETSGPVYVELLPLITWELEHYPVFVDVGYSEPNHPLIVSFPFDWNNLGIKDTYAVVDNNKLIMLENVDLGMNRFDVYRSDYSYVAPSRQGNLIVSNASVSTTNIQAHPQGGYFDTFILNNQTAIEDFEVHLNAISLNSLNYSVDESNSTIHYRRSYESEFLNMTTYLFSSKSRIYNFIKPNYDTNLSRYDFVISGKLYGYGKYYFNNDYFDTLDFEVPGCFKLNESFVNFYNQNSSGFAILLANRSIISFCYDLDDLDRREIEFEITLPLEKESYLHFFNHEESYNGSRKFMQADTSIIGAAQKISGLNINQTEQLLREDYSSMRDHLSVSGIREFSFEILNGTLTNQSLYAYEPMIPGFNIDVFVKSYDCDFLDPYGDFRSCKLVVKTW